MKVEVIETVFVLCNTLATLLPGKIFAAMVFFLHGCLPSKGLINKKISLSHSALY